VYAYGSQDTHASDLEDGLAMIRPFGLSISEHVYNVLDSNEKNKLTPILLLWSLFYGEESLHADQRCKSARQQFTSSLLLRDLLNNIHSPPRTQSKGATATTGQHVLENFACEVVESKLSEELSDYGDTLHLGMLCSVPEDSDQHSLIKSL